MHINIRVGFGVSQVLRRDASQRYLARLQSGQYRLLLADEENLQLVEEDRSRMIVQFGRRPGEIGIALEQRVVVGDQFFQDEGSATDRVGAEVVGSDCFISGRRDDFQSRPARRTAAHAASSCAS